MAAAIIGGSVAQAAGASRAAERPCQLATTSATNHTEPLRIGF
jgi:hypothetical protein